MVTREDFLSLCVGDKIIDENGNEWVVVLVNQLGDKSASPIVQIQYKQEFIIETTWSEEDNAVMNPFTGVLITELLGCAQLKKDAEFYSIVDHVMP